MVWTWKEFDNKGNMVNDVGMVARLMGQNDIHGILQQDVIVNPGEACVFIKDGKIEDIMTQTRLKNVGGGFTNWLKGKMSVGTSISLLFIDTTPIDLQFPIAATTKDYADIKGACTVRIQIVPENATKIINMMRRAPARSDQVPGFLWDSVRTGQVLTRDVIQSRLNDELVATVFTAQIAQYTAPEFRGNVEILRNMEEQAQIEMRKSLDMWGLSLLRLFTVWGKTDFDGVMAVQRQYSMQLQSWNGVQDLYHTGVLADLRRQQEKAMTEQSDKWARVRGDVAGEESVTTQRVISEKDRDQIAAEADVKRQSTTATGLEGIATMRTGEEVKRVDMQHGQDMKMKRDELGYQKDKEFTRLDVEGREDEQDAVQIKRLVEVKKDMKAHSVDQDIKRYQGIEMEGKKLDSTTAIELARLEAEKAKALALADAEKAKYQMDTFTRAEDRERAHQYQMTGLSSNMMQASKQGTPTTLVQGAGFTSANVGTGQPGGEDTIMCHNCGEKVRKGKFCLSCGAKLG
jgi:hypothetical protein